MDTNAAARMEQSATLTAQQFDAAGLSNQAGAFDVFANLTSLPGGTSSQEYGVDECIFSQGDAADAVFYILSGKVKLAVVSQNGKQAVIAVLPETSFFGESCLEGRPLRLATAIAVEMSSVIRVTKQAMTALLLQEPKFAERFLGYILSRNVRIEADWADLLTRVDNTILCIDDEEPGLVLRKAMLQNKGYEVLTALNGPDGLKLFKDNPVEGVVLDYSMPGMNGGQVAAELKRLNPEIKILLLSAYSDFPEETLRLVDKRSQKGVSPGAFLSDLEQLLSS